jgi:hypothetical protein
MKTRSIQLLTAALLSIGALLHYQYREKELLIKEKQLTYLQRSLADREVRSITSKRGPQLEPSSSTATRIAHIRKFVSEPLDLESFRELLDRKHSEHHYIQAWHELFFALINRDQAELEKLLGEVKNSDVPDDSLKRLERDILQIYPSKEDFETQIRASLRGSPNIYGYTQLFERWLSSEPNLARKWLDQEIEAQELTGKGLSDDPLESMTHCLVSNLFRESSPDAMAYYSQLPGSGKLAVRSHIASRLTQTGPAKLKSFFEGVSDPEIRKGVIQATVGNQAGKNHSPDDIIAFSQNLNLSDSEQGIIIQSIAQNTDLFKGDSLQTRIDWIQQNSGYNNFKPFISGLTSSSYQAHREELEAWAAQQTDPETRNDIYRNLNLQAVFQEKNHQRAASYFAQISDLKIQQKIYRDFNQSNSEALKTRFDQQLTSEGVDLETLRQD